MEITGKITKVLETVSGTSSAGKEWSKLSFIVTNQDGYEGADADYCFEVFGEEKVEKFSKFNKIGDEVDVKFNIRTNEFKGKYYTSLQSWSVFKAEAVEEAPEVAEAEEDDLPF